MGCAHLLVKERDEAVDRCGCNVAGGDGETLDVRWVRGDGLEELPGLKINVSSAVLVQKPHLFVPNLDGAVERDGINEAVGEADRRHGAVVGERRVAEACLKSHH
jgi:hypothetical protein